MSGGNFKDIPEHLLAGLNVRQYEAVTALDGPVLVVAGPGSGKTRVLTHRVAAMIATERAKPWEIMAVTFTNKAAAEMRERIKVLVGDEAEKIWVATFHATCARLLRSNHEAAKLPSNFTILDADDAQRVLRNVLVDLELPSEAADVREISHVISRARNNNITADELERDFPRDSHASEPYRLYNKRLHEMGAVDFDELLIRTATLLEDNPEVVERYRIRFKYILVDEYQDTNPVQYKLTRLLTNNNGNICVVGDFDQSIYAWRGATPEVMAGFTADYPLATVVALEENYRSTEQIVAVCRSVIEPNPSVHRPKLFTNNGSGDGVRLIACLDDRDEARTVVRELANLPAGSNAAILLRTNAQSRPFEEELASVRVPYSVVGALRFYDRSEVRDALSWMKVAMNGRDVIAFNRAASTPRRGLGDTTLELIVQLSREREISVVEAARELLESKSLPTRAVAPVTGFLEGIAKVRVAATAFGPAAGLRVLYDDVGLREHYLKDREEGESRVENIEALYAGAEAYSIEEPEVATAAFLENAALVAAADSEVETARRVLIMTAHASKGREFDWVYVAGVEDIYFPMARPGATADEFEERRLLFVACSRARKRLTLSYCEHRLRYGKVSETGISPFLDALPVDVVRVITPSRQHGVRQGQSSRGQQRPWNSKEFSADPPRGVQPTKPPRRNVGNRLTPSQVTAGVKVRHSTFGEGTVVCMHDGSDPTVEIYFSVGSRTLALSLAPLELL